MVRAGKWSVFWWASKSQAAISLSLRAKSKSPLVWPFLFWQFLYSARFRCFPSMDGVVGKTPVSSRQIIKVLTIRPVSLTRAWSGQSNFFLCFQIWKKEAFLFERGWMGSVDLGSSEKKSQATPWLGFRTFFRVGVIPDSNLSSNQDHFSIPFWG